MHSLSVPVEQVAQTHLQSPPISSILPSVQTNQVQTHTLSLGRNIPDAGTVTEQMWQSFLKDTVCVLMPCCTITDGIGIWKGEIEQTKIISVTVDERSLGAVAMLDNLRAVGDEWKRQFRQECVMLTTSQVAEVVFA